ncbi:MAG TPA: HlyD family efflux transporter periplasmic adaptor subunit [Roseiflexaceae bacterium]|nr:HlyD family efflux transporter periplasmic adaptor subunit [Roseiflexaceae bacterium]
MKKLIIGMLILVLLGGGVYFSFGRVALAPAQAPVAAAAPVTASNAIVAEAKVVPIRSATLSLSIGGIVAEVLVKEGDQVQAGQVLARLDDADLKLTLDKAQVDLKQAKADQQALLKGATPETIAAAKARIAQAQGQYQQTAGSVTKADIAAARANLAAAQARLAELQAGHTGVRDAELGLQQAQTQLQARRDQLSQAKTDAQLQMQQRVNDLTKAQSAYATAKQNWEYVQQTGRDPSQVVLDPQSGKKSHLKLDDKQKQQYADAFVQAEAMMHNAEAALQQAQVDYDAARQAELTGIQAAEQDVASDQSKLDAQRAGGDRQQLAAAQAQVATAQAELNRLTGASRSGNLEAAQASVAEAEAELAKLRADPDSSELARAEAAVARAELAVKQAQRALDQATLTAPFAGTISALDLKLREYVAPGAPIARLADNSAWQIETTDLTELNVAKAYEDAPATISFDALPGVTLPGTVTRIKGFGENKQGDITYTVVVKPKLQDARLRWNMTASVSIDGR